MYHQPEEIKNLSCAARLDPKSFRGRKNQENATQAENGGEQQFRHRQADNHNKKAEKKKRQRQRKKQKKEMEINGLQPNHDMNTMQTEGDEGTLERTNETKGYDTNTTATTNALLNPTLNNQQLNTKPSETKNNNTQAQAQAQTQPTKNKKKKNKKQEAAANAKVAN